MTRHIGLHGTLLLLNKKRNFRISCPLHFHEYEGLPKSQRLAENKEEKKILLKVDLMIFSVSVLILPNI